MIEVVFNDSAAGSLKVAQRFGKGKYPENSAVSVYVCHKDGTPATDEELEEAKKEFVEKERLAWEKAISLGGTAADVFCFELALSTGAISKDVFEMNRQSLLGNLTHTYPDDSKQYVRDLACRMKDSIRNIRIRLEQREEIRIWFSNQPDELCGFCWFMDWLNQLGIDENSIHFVKLPEWETEENGTLLHRISFAEVDAARWHRYLLLQKTASRVILQTCSAHWNQLVQENAPLRAVVNGRLTSVSEDFYDSFIRREIKKLPAEFREGNLIGNVFGYGFGISDSLIHSRIEQMLFSGELKVAAMPEDGQPAYCRLLRI